MNEFVRHVWDAKGKKADYPFERQSITLLARLTVSVKVASRSGHLAS